MVHLRIVAPAGAAGRALELLKADGSVTNVVYLANAAQKPDGDLILCDVAREDARVVLADLKNLDIPKYGSITLEYIETQLSEAGERAEEHAPGLPSDAVVWEDVESRTSEETELSASFLAFMVVAMQIAAVGILLDQPILIVGAMVVGPEFGPLAAFSAAVVELPAGSRSGRSPPWLRAFRSVWRGPCSRRWCSRAPAWSRTTSPATTIR